VRHQHRGDADQRNDAAGTGDDGRTLRIDQPLRRLGGQIRRRGEELWESAPRSVRPVRPDDQDVIRLDALRDALDIKDT